MYGTPTCLSQQDVLSCLGHRTISSTYNQDRSIWAAPVIMFFT